LIPTFLGLFAMTEIMSLMMSPRSTISGKARIQDLSGELWEGVWSCFQHFGLFIRCSIIGTVVGMIPSIGATVASFMAYGHAKQSAGRDQTLFGRGNIRGVLAPEAANDAKDGGSLLPTLALGIPGSLGTAMLLVVLNLHGITPGKELLDENLRMAFILIWSMFFSNWLTSILGMLIVNPLVRLTTVRTHLLLPIIIALVTTGAYVFRGRFEDILVAYLFGLIGYGMKIFDWPRIPLLIAFVLGPLFENNFLITLKLHELGTINFWQRPIAMSLLVLTLASLALPYLPFNQGGAARKGSDV
jgi:TctA family transporter